MLFEQIESKFHEKKLQNTLFHEKKPQSALLQVLVLVAGILLAELMRTDYSGLGVITIAIMYYFHQNKKKETLLGCLALTIGNSFEIFAFAIYPLTARYNGQRGLNLKYLFYAFYPVHIFLLALVSQLLGFR